MLITWIEKYFHSLDLMNVYEKRATNEVWPTKGITMSPNQVAWEIIALRLK